MKQNRGPFRERQERIHGPISLEPLDRSPVVFAGYAFGLPGCDAPEHQTGNMEMFVAVASGLGSSRNSWIFRKGPASFVGASLGTKILIGRRDRRPCLSGGALLTP